MDKDLADKLMGKTRENYDNFSGQFAQTRNYIWPEMRSLAADRVKTGDRVLDIGCGNGRYYPFFMENGANYAGIDNSKNLVDIAKKSFPEADFAVADALSLPFAAAEFDLAVSIAVLHHIPSQERRRALFGEAWRILKPGGCLIIVVWDLRLPSMIKARQWKRAKGFAKTQINILLGLEKIDFGDFFIPWQNECQRYVHAFTPGELRSLAQKSGFSVEKEGVSRLGSREGNLYIVARKA